jgi:hypothetical protein
MFDRWKCAWNKTWAFWLFKKHHTELNSLYWAHLASYNNSLKTIKSYPPETLASAVFPLPQSDKGRLNRTTEQWKTEYKEFNNWVNLSAAVSLASYIEIYLQSVVTLSLESDPAILLGASRAVDGAKFLKTKSDYSYAENAIPVLKGTWQERAQVYKNYFGKLPEAFEKSVGDLDELRILRNGVGHTFGRPVDVYKSAKINIEIKPLQRLSHERLKKWLGIAEYVVTGIDEHLRDTHIGSYEAVLYFHKWLKETNHNTFDHVPYKKHLNSLLGIVPNKDYFRALSRYYSRL